MSPRLMVVDDDPLIRETLVSHFEAEAYAVTEADCAEQALSRLAAARPQIMLSDIRMTGMDGLSLLRLVKARAPDVIVLVMTAFEDMQTAVEAMQAGAHDYLVKPLDLDQIDKVVTRCANEIALTARHDDAALGEMPPAAPDGLIGRDARMIAIYKRIGAAARTVAPVLLRGETGTGKELVARAIHRYSARATAPFVAVNCAALPEPLLESELFGHVRGAFTGAVQDRRGRFEAARGGTIFLDEIGETTPAFQARLLRVLQEHTYTPVGSDETRRSDARVIAATHRPLELLIPQGAFREDLYFRLRVMELVLPSLRERRGDIPLLAEHLLRKGARELARTPVQLTPGALKRLEQYDWPGNVRELENTLARALAEVPGAVIDTADLMLDATMTVAEPGEQPDQTLDAVERRHVESVFRAQGFNKRRTCRVLGVSRPRLDRLLERHGIEGRGNDS